MITARAWLGRSAAMTSPPALVSILEEHGAAGGRSASLSEARAVSRRPHRDCFLRSSGAQHLPRRSTSGNAGCRTDRSRPRARSSSTSPGSSTRRSRSGSGTAPRSRSGAPARTARASGSPDPGCSARCSGGRRSSTCSGATRAATSTSRAAICSISSMPRAGARRRARFASGICARAFPGPRRCLCCSRTIGRPRSVTSSMAAMRPGGRRTRKRSSSSFITMPATNSMSSSSIRRWSIPAPISATGPTRSRRRSGTSSTSSAASCGCAPARASSTSAAAGARSCAMRQSATASLATASPCPRRSTIMHRPGSSVWGCATGSRSR